MINIVHNIRMAKGSNKKLAILKDEYNNAHWRSVLLAMYDTSINYYVSAPTDTTFVEDEDLDVASMIYMLSELSSRTYTGNAARKVALECSEEYGEIFRLILNGSMKAGVSTTTINKAYPGLIPTFDVMLAKDVPVQRFPVWASTKYDGVRVIAFIKDGDVILKTRQGKALRIDSLVNAMRDMPEGVYDGELVDGDGKMAGRSTISGSVTKCIRGTADDISGYTYCIFDYVKTDEWDNKRGQSDYGERYRSLTDIIHKYGTGVGIIRADQIVLRSQAEVDGMYEDLVDRGYEGLILRYPENLYTWARTPLLIKKKAIKDCVLTCVDVKEGTGKYEGLIGALVCKGKVEDKHVSVSLGTGLSDHDREEAHEYFVGHKVEAQYNDVVQAKDRTDYSLFLPRFKRKLGKVDT